MRDRPADRSALAAQQLDKLRALLAEVLPRNPFYARKLGSAEVRSLADLAALPFTTKEELLEDQAAHPPYGTNLTYPLTAYCRLHQTSGSKGRPLRWLDTPASWRWFQDCWAIIYETIGLTPADRFFFPFSFGPFIGFWAAFEGATRLGNLALAAGGMSSTARLRFLLENSCTVVCCTPTYALRLAEVAVQEGLDLPASPVRALVVAGEPGGSVPATKARIEAAWGARVFDHTGMTEIGSLGIECVENPGGVHLLETECIPEVIDPDTCRAVAPGEEGELVLTNLGRWGSPLIRYRTGDRVALDPQPCPCGRPWVRLPGGIRARTDDLIFIRGNNVYPGTLEDLLRRFPEVVEYRVEIVEGPALTDLCLHVECVPGGDAPSLLARVRDAVRDALHLRADVRLAPAGSLPRFEMKSQRVVRTTRGS
jgi:phenylacetate-CoA ligase